MKKCLSCDNELSNRYSKYCSSKCLQDHRYRCYIQSWLDGKEDGIRHPGKVSSYIRRWLFEKHDHQCQKCGWGEVNKHTGLIPLTVNHVDGNAFNNRPENLELLCPNCHSLTSTYGGGNRGNGRAYRREQYKSNKR